MCFRPSAVVNDGAGNAQTTDCPTCGMPVAAEKDAQSGTCPYCGNPIPASPSNVSGVDSAGGNVRIL